MSTDHTMTEAKRQVIQRAIDAGKSTLERNRLGQFATPNNLAINIVQYVGSLMDHAMGEIRFADPALGSGSFFSAAITVYGPARISRAIGVELDPALAAAAQDLWTDAGLEVLQGDFTRLLVNDSAMPTPNLILANPPYVRHHHVSRLEKERLQAVTRKLVGIDVNGLAGLYVYFVLLATVWMESGGYAAWLIPSEFMDVNYGASLKRFLTDRVTLIRAHRFDPDAVQFGDAMVSSVVIVFRNLPPSRDHAPEFTFGGTVTEPHASDFIPLDRLRQSRKWTAFPEHAKNDRHTHAENHGPKLADFLRIQRGIVTGDNKFFVLDRQDAIRRGFPAQYLRPILPSPRYLKTTIVDGDDDGYPVLDRQLCVIDCDLPEDVVEQNYPRLWQYLQTAGPLGIKEGYIIGKRTPWYKQEQRGPAPFLCTYMGRGANEERPFRFILNRSQAIGTNLYLMLSPRNALAAMLRAHPERTSTVHQMLARISGHELRGEGRVYGGGLNKIEPRELGRISARPFVEQWPELLEGVQTPSQMTLFAG